MLGLSALFETKFLSSSANPFLGTFQLKLFNERKRHVQVVPIEGNQSDELKRGWRLTWITSTSYPWWFSGEVHFLATQRCV